MTRATPARPDDAIHAIVRETPRSPGRPRCPSEDAGEPFQAARAAIREDWVGARRAFTGSAKMFRLKLVDAPVRNLLRDHGLVTWRHGAPYGVRRLRWSLRRHPGSSDFAGERPFGRALARASMAAPPRPPCRMPEVRARYRAAEVIVAIPIPAQQQCGGATLQPRARTDAGDGPPRPPAPAGAAPRPPAAPATAAATPEMGSNGKWCGESAPPPQRNQDQPLKRKAPPAGLMAPSASISGAAAAKPNSDEIPVKAPLTVAVQKAPPPEPPSAAPPALPSTAPQQQRQPAHGGPPAGSMAPSASVSGAAAAKPSGNVPFKAPPTLALQKAPPPGPLPAPPRHGAAAAAAAGPWRQGAASGTPSPRHGAAASSTPQRSAPAAGPARAVASIQGHAA